MGGSCCFFFFQAEDGIRDYKVTGVQTCALPIFTACQGIASLEVRGEAGREWASLPTGEPGQRGGVAGGIGRGAGRGRGEISGGGPSLKKKKTKTGNS